MISSKFFFFINKNLNKNLLKVKNNNIQNICIIEINNHINNSKIIHNFLLDCNKFNFNSEKIINKFINHQLLKQEMKHIYNCYNYIFINNGLYFYLCRLYINFERTLKIIENSSGIDIIENLFNQDSKLIEEIIFNIKKNRTNIFKMIFNFSETNLSMSNIGYININLTITNIKNKLGFYKLPAPNYCSCKNTDKVALDEKDLDEKELEKKLKCLFYTSFNSESTIFYDIHKISDYLKINLQSIFKLDYENIKSK